MKLVYEELLERAKEKEEKEAKKRQRLADDFTKLLYSFKVWWHWHHYFDGDKHTYLFGQFYVMYFVVVLPRRK